MPTKTPAVLSCALVAVCTGYFMVILDSTIVNVALPALRTDLRAGVNGLQWVVDGYLLVLAAGLLSGGALADRFGARRVFQAGLGVFVAASLGCGLAPDVTVLVLARVAQGAGAALSVPASLALLRAAYTDRTARARAVGVWGGIAGVAAAGGPLLGGVLVAATGWRWVFFVNVPIGLAAMALTARYVPAPRARPGHGLDPAGQLTGVVALTALALTMIEGGRSGVNALVALSALVFVLAGAAFVAVERAVRAPMLPLGLFRTPTFAGGTAVGLLINLGFYGELFVVNLSFQQTLHYSALLAGLALLPQMGVVAAGSWLSGRFTARVGSPRPTLLIGLITGGVGLLGMAASASQAPYALLVLPLMATGFGMSFSMPAVTTAVTDGVPGERAGLASGVINAARQTGGVVGVALLGALAGGGAVAGLRTALAVAGLAFLAGALITLRTVDRAMP
ncbi:DHA2 family efflux MFS transporter permease subunit [Streptomyces sp. NPDC059850]|uniref:DHA2 family efflux MFS transporter permease subunit n=1 Tax=Streptomyces sp. NPDC059850 TaxID=3346970 RepID=UPI00365183C3